MEETTRKDGNRGKVEKGQVWQQTLTQAGLLGSNILLTEDTPNLSVSKELKESGEKQDSFVGSVGVKISVIPLTD